MLRPQSRGAMRLASSNPHVAPLIDPALLPDERDVAGMLRAMRLERELGQAAMTPWRRAPRHPSTSSYNQARTTSAPLHLGSALLLLELLRLATTVSLATEGLSVI
jgi:choline dehydrogenase-like flavoprotein